MKTLEVQNNQLFSIDEIPFVEKEEFRNSVLEALTNGSKMIALTPIDSRKPGKIIAALSDSNSSMIYIVG
jgi:hypothetical protein